MTDKIDRSLDEILADNRAGNRNRRGGGGPAGRRRERVDYPRDGVRKSYTRDEQRNLDSEWVHDRFEDNQSRRAPVTRRRQESPDYSRGSRIRVENIHYDLAEDELEELFSKIGPVIKFKLLYDRAGRSEGIAFVTYEDRRDAQQAIRDYDGANANGQPIRLSLVANEAPPRSRNPFDTAVMPSRPLAERITAPAGRARSHSPALNYDEDDAARKGIDRYVPGGGGSRSRSPMPPRRPGRRPGARRDGGRENDGQQGRQRQGKDGRPRKTQEELDAEMADYFGGGGSRQGTNGAAGNAQPLVEDIDMIE